MQVVFPTAALARGLRFDQWRGSVLLLLSHWRVWIGAPGEEQAFHGDGTSENLGLGLQTRRGGGRNFVLMGAPLLGVRVGFSAAVVRGAEEYQANQPLPSMNGAWRASPFAPLQRWFDCDSEL